MEDRIPAVVLVAGVVELEAQLVVQKAQEEKLVQE
jgi:hypothetical protein